MDNRLFRRSESEHLPDRSAPPPDAEEDPRVWTHRARPT